MLLGTCHFWVELMAWEEQGLAQVYLRRVVFELWAVFFVSWDLY